jgi:hypothetical protein
MKAKELLIELDACVEAIDWAGDMTVQEAWDACPRGDWMLWFYSKQYPENIKELTLAKGHCANTVRHLMKDERSIAAIDAAIAFGECKTTQKELDDAYDHAYAAYVAAYAAYVAAVAASASASYAADVAAAAAAAADVAAAAYASYVASAAIINVAYAAAASADKKQNQQQTADICRKYLDIKQ